MKPLLLSPLVLLLVACGGGESQDTSTAAPEPVATTSVSTDASTNTGAADNTADTPPSTLLSEQQAPTNAEFNQFRSHSVILDLNQYQFDGDTLYLKLYQDDGGILFLGKVSPNQRVSLPLNLPSTQTRVHFDLFSDHPSDQAVKGELAL